MDILNFISWIRGKRQVTSVDPTKSVLPVGLKDPKRDDQYLAGAISVEDFTAQVASVIPSGAQGPAGPQGVPGPVGPAGLNWQGAWVSGASYVVDDAVGYGGASWFCINNTSGTTNPSADPTNWALLASQGATGPQGPQGIQGPAGPSGSGLPGTAQGQTTYWNTATSQWTPTSGLVHNGTGQIGINAAVFGGYKLNMNANTGAALRLINTTTGGAVSNQLITTTATFQFGLNPSSATIPNSAYFTTNGNYAIKFATSGTDRMLITGTGDVYIGTTVLAGPSERFVVAGGNIFITDVGSGLVTYSPDGTRYKITVDNTGTVIATPYP
jgi:hypothetical protein